MHQAQNVEKNEQIPSFSWGKQIKTQASPFDSLRVTFSDNNASLWQQQRDMRCGETSLGKIKHHTEKWEWKSSWKQTHLSATFSKFLLQKQLFAQLILPECSYALRETQASSTMDLTFISWSTARQSEDRLTDRALTETWPRQVLHVLAQEGWMGMAANTSVSLNVRLSCHEAGTHSTTWYLACSIPRVAFSTIVSLNAMQRPSSHGPGVTPALEQARDPTHCHWGTLKAQHSMSFMSCYVQSVPRICSSWFFFFRSLLSWKSNYCQYDLASLFQAPYKAMMKESLFCWNSIELPSSNPWWHACGFLFEGVGEKK